MVTPLYRPSVRVNQQFARSAASAGEDLGLFVYGPAAAVFRYGKTTEKPQISLGTYDPVGTLISGDYVHLYNYPQRPVGSILDAAFVKVFCDSAYLRVHNDTSKTAVRVLRNTIRHSGKIYKTANGYSSNVGDRGLKVGDRVLVSGVDASAAPFSLATYITGFTADKGSSSVAAAVAASSNPAVISSASATITAGSSNSGTVTASAAGTAYNGLAAGLLVESYTITVTTGGAASSARLKVVSQSGTDDVASVTPATLSSPTTIGTRGLTVTFATGTSSAFTVGDVYTIVATQAYALPTLTTSGTYAGKSDRTYIVEVLTGGAFGTARVRVSSQDGTDSLQPVVVAAGSGQNSLPVTLGSYGLTLVFNSAGLFKGAKWTIAATAAPDTQVRTLQLAHDFPANVATDTTAELQIQAFMVKDIEIPRRSTTASAYNYTAQNSQLSLKGGILIKDAEWTSGGVPEAVPLLSPSGFGAVSQVFVEYRAWISTGSGIISLTATDTLDTLLPGPTDPDNPLKYALSVARSGAGSQPISYFVVGNPAVLDGWTAALDSATRQRNVYGHVPLTQDQNVLSQVFSHVVAMNGPDANFYRVMWWGAREQVGKVVLDRTKSSNTQLALAVCEDDAASAGTQYTQLRLTSSNADLLALGVRAGDVVRYLFEADEWGDETYVSRTIASVVSATTLLVTEPLSGAETVAKRIEIHRVFNAAEKKQAYIDEVGLYSADTVRAVVSPKVYIGSYVLPSYYAALILAATRSALPAQQPLSGYVVPGIANVTGLEVFSEGALAEISGSGGTVVNYETQSSQVIVYRAVTTTGDMTILAKREESMVSARHANLFAIVDRLKVFSGNSNLTDDPTVSSDLSNLIRAELQSVTNELKQRNYTPALLGQMVELTIDSIGVSALFEDVLEISGTMTLGRPTNRIDFNVLIT